MRYFCLSAAALICLAGRLLAANAPTTQPDKTAIRAAQHRVVDAAKLERDKITDGDERQVALGFIVMGLAASGDISGAKAMADRLPEKNRGIANWVIAKGSAQMGDVAGAISLADSIDDAFPQASAYIDIATVQVENHDNKNAVQIISKALNCAEKITPVVLADHCRGQAADIELKLLDFTRAKEIASTMNGVQRDLAIEGIAVAQARAGEIDGAESTIKSLGDPDFANGARQRALRVRAATRASAFDFDGAKAISVGLIPANKAWVDEWVTLNHIVQSVGNGSIVEVLSKIDAIPDAKSDRYMELAWSRLEVGDYAGLQACLAKAEIFEQKEIEEGKEESDTTGNVTGIAALLIRTGRADEAIAFIQKVLPKSEVRCRTYCLAVSMANESP